MLNNNLLSNSDFFTGAYPAEYGNALSGVFDLRLRSGNNRQREYTAQVGINGFEIGLEGPFSSEYQASYIAHYRYSSFALLRALGLKFGVTAVPYYQDLSFKVDIPGTRAGRWSVFGLGGKNHIVVDEDDTFKKSLTRISSNLGIVGLSHIYFINKTLRIRNNLSCSIVRDNEMDSLNRNGILEDFYWDQCTEKKYSFSTDLKKKISSRNHLIMGFDLDLIRVNYRDSLYSLEITDFFHTLDIGESILLVQSYLHWKHRFTDNLTLISGLHHQQITLNSQKVVEPRLSISWDLTDKYNLSIGYGLHSQMQPRIIYYEKTLIDTLNRIYIQTNKELLFTKSHHAVMGFHYLINPDLRLKTEVYFQKLFDVPVKQTPSYVSLINYGSSFYYGDYDSLENEGTGRNIGLELTFEHFFTGNYYYLVTFSLFDSKYKASDEVIRNTAYNGNFILNLLGGYEFQLTKQNAFSIDLKTVWAGGLRSIPIDLEQSRLQGRTIYDISRAYEKSYSDYYRVDLRLAVKINRPKHNHLIALDIQNLTNRKNRFLNEYDPDSAQIESVYQIGILPVVLWRINF